MEGWLVVDFEGGWLTPHTPQNIGGIPWYYIMFKHGIRGGGLDNHGTSAIHPRPCYLDLGHHLRKGVLWCILDGARTMGLGVWSGSDRKGCGAEMDLCVVWGCYHVVWAWYFA